jgi:putative transposase
MSHYKRWYQPGGTYFFTVVTCQRRKWFSEPRARELLGKAMRDVAEELSFETLAIVLLPDHLHTVWTLPPDDDDFSSRWKTIKDHFTTAWLESGGAEAPISESQKKRGHRGVWQRRFWEHLIRDEDDLEAHCDYIHYNPVKHGLVKTPSDWPHSTFRRFVEKEYYQADWGSAEPENIKDMDFE